MTCLRNKVTCAMISIILAVLLMLSKPSSISNASALLTNAHAFPVPFVPSKGDSSITFTDLSAEATIRIYSQSGSLVQTLNAAGGNGLYAWDTRTSDGNDLASGVYVFVISSSVDEKKGKLVIVR